MPTPHALTGTSPRQLVSPRERIYYGAILVLSVTVYTALVLAALSKLQVAATIITYGILSASLGCSHMALPWDGSGEMRYGCRSGSSRCCNDLPWHMRVSSGSSRFQLPT